MLITYSNVEKICTAAGPLCNWVCAMERYFWVTKAVDPLREKLKDANGNYHY